MKLRFLGTGGGVPSKLRNVTSIALEMLQERKAVWLFDCGEATQHQILHTPIRPRRIEKIFITHLHGDHIYGLPGLLGSRSFQGGEGPLTVYGPVGIKRFIDTTLSVSQTHLKYPLKIVEIEQEGVIFEDEQIKVITKWLDHAIPSLGFRVEEKDRVGTLDMEKISSLGVKPGPHLKDLKLGNAIEWDGIIIDPSDVLGEPIKGRVATILGDTRVCKGSKELMINADVCVHEATFSSEQTKMAFDYFHSTTTQAASAAKEMNVKKLLLTHISSRFLPSEWKDLEKEARSIFDNSFVVSDFEEEEV
ncbi:ribonuclease Z [Mangrovibacillus cuniculi]|uniref:Ribonuclease Z n=1 Tax=Mangrovibacillus cuniculi TaxID=2593652 RepID=A0A7S8CBJ6_9BACI|nr:ribonuclease Z [Mangrovibacillus cuniculi]QPC46783.1 ribonuclease Z [Mangrovibacillus cuniculi]